MVEMISVSAQRLEPVNIKYADTTNRTALIANILFNRFILRSDDGLTVRKRKIMTNAAPKENI